MSINAKNYEAHINLGAVYAMKNDYPNAIKEYETALNLCPNSADKAKVYFNLGAAYMQIGRDDIAKGMWKEALRIDPNLEKARENLRKLE